MELTPLHLAVLNESFFAFDILLKSGADSKIKNEQGVSVTDLVNEKLKWTKFNARLNERCFI